MESPKVAPAPVTHTVTIMPAAGGCSAKPWELKDVGPLDQVCFTNPATSPIVIKFDSLELFGVGSITVPPNSTSCKQVAKTAKPGTVHLYSVSCSPLAGEARPRIVIRSS